MEAWRCSNKSELPCTCYYSCRNIPDIKQEKQKRKVERK